MRYSIQTLILAAVIPVAALSCRSEALQDLSGDRTRQVSLSLEDIGTTRTDVDGNSGKVTWTSDDVIGVFISSPERGDAYRHIPVDAANDRVVLPLDPGEVRCAYAVYPYSASQVGDPDPAGSHPRVLFPDTYDLSDHGTETYAPVPMMALNDDDGDILDFFHVGGLVRLDLHNVPAGTTAITVEFVGMDQVFGVCSVSDPGTVKATTALVGGTGTGNVATFTGVTAATTHLNIPVPTLDFSPLTFLKVRTYETLEGEPTHQVSKGVVNSWGQFKHAYGRLVPVDFNYSWVLSEVRLSASSDITLWRSQTIRRTAKAICDDGTVFPDIEFEWTTSDASVATVNPASGFVTAVAPGSAVITATATPEVGAAVSASYTVIVNAITGLSLDSAEDFVEWYGKTLPMTATLTHTDNGEIIAYPGDMVSWSTSAPASVGLGETANHPVRRDDTHGTVTVMAVGAEKGDISSVIKVSVNPKYVVSASSQSASKSILCKPVTRMDTRVRTVRGMEFSPSYLMQPSIGLWAFADDLLDLWNHLPLNGVVPYAYPRYHFTWTELAEYFDGDATDDIACSLNTFENGDGTWVIPSRADLERLMSAEETELGSTIYVDGSVFEGRKHFACVELNLTGHTYVTDDLSYNLGVLFFPDDADIYCKSLMHPDKVNVSLEHYMDRITYDDLMTLIDGGCVFFPLTGLARESLFYRYEGIIRNWSATKDGSSAYLIQISTWLQTVNTLGINEYACCRLIKKTDL